MIQVEKCLLKDLGHITQMEINTQEFPLLIDDIKPYTLEKGKEAYLAKASKRIVGYALIEFDKFKGVAFIDSIGVHPNFRKVGVGARLAKYIRTQAYAEDMVKVQMLVPSYVVDDKEDPWNILGWLRKIGFRAVGVQEGCFRYGRLYDWYIFERCLS